MTGLPDVPLSNSLMMHQVQTKKIVAIIYIDFCDFSFLVLVPIEKIYQTLKTEFDQISKHLEVPKNSPLRVVFYLSFRSMEMWSNTVFHKGLQIP